MSYVNHRYKHVFIHVPRTGGTSMLSHYFIGPDDAGHDPLRSVMRRPDYDPSYLRWSFVRHPLDRLVSAYFHVVECHQFNRYTDFRDFVRRDFEQDGRYAAVNSRLFGHGEGHAHFTPMFDLLRDDSETVGVEFVGHYESLAADWRALCEALGIEAPPLGQLNESGTYGGEKRGDWRAYYDDETMEIATNVYRNDFEAFGYSSSS